MKILSLYIHWRPYNGRSYFVFPPCLIVIKILSVVTICQIWPARPVHLRAELYFTCHIRQCKNIIHCWGGFAGKSREKAKAHFTFKTIRPVG